MTRLTTATSWLTSFIFTAQDYNLGVCGLNAPPGGRCSLKHALEAFTFLALYDSPCSHPAPFPPFPLPPFPLSSLPMYTSIVNVYFDFSFGCLASAMLEIYNLWAYHKSRSVTAHPTKEVPRQSAETEGTAAV